MNGTLLKNQAGHSCNSVVRQTTDACRTVPLTGRHQIFWSPVKYTVLYRDGAGNAVEENSSVFSLIRMR